MVLVLLRFRTMRYDYYLPYSIDIYEKILYNLLQLFTVAYYDTHQRARF